MLRIALPLLLSVVLWALSLVMHQPDEELRLEREAARSERTVRGVRSDLLRDLSVEAKLLETLPAPTWLAARITAMERLRLRTGTVFLLFERDSLVAWSGHVGAEVEELRKDSLGRLHRNDGVWSHASARVNGMELHALRPIWIIPSIENRYLVRGFHPSINAPSGLQAEQGAGLGPVVRDEAGNVIFRLSWKEGALEVGAWLVLRLIMSLLAIGCFVLVLWRVAMLPLLARRFWTSVFFFLASMLFLRWMMLVLMPATPFGRLPLFDPAIYATSFVFGSLGDLLINALFLLIITLFLWRSAWRATRAATHPITQFLTWSILLAYAAWITQLIIGLVNDSSVELDLYHVQGLSTFSLAAVSAVAMLLASWCIAALALLRPPEASTSDRTLWATGALALVISVGLHHLLGVVDTVLFLWPVIPLVLLVRIAKGRPVFLHLVLILAVLAGAGAHMLTRFNHTREQRERQVLAERITSREDPVVEYMFRETAPRLRKDSAVYAMLTDGRVCGAGELDRLVRQPFFGGYWERYDVRLFAFDTLGRVLCSTDPEPPSSMAADTALFTSAISAADMPDLIMEERLGRTTFYHARVAVMPTDSLPPVQLIVELHLRPVSQGLGFPDLLLSGDDALTRRSDRYVKARYERGTLVEQHGGPSFPVDWTREIPDEGVLWYADNGYEYLARGSATGTLLILGLPLPSALDKATSFSYLFAFFGLVVALAYLLRAIVERRGFGIPGIGTKIRLALVLFAVVGLVFFGLGTQRLLSRQYAQRFDAAIMEKARSVHADLQQRLDGETRLGPRQAPYLDHLLGRLSNVFFTDINVYDTRGVLLATSRPQVFANGLLGVRLDPVAQVELVYRGSSGFVHQEHIGEATFRTGYLPLRDRRGVVLGYLALPSFADQVQQEDERSAVLVAVINLFVVLFALSVLLAVFISNWTTRPLDLLKHALGRVALQGANEPIRYRGDDEVGQLVEVYNRKVAELHDSAQKLARSERESAWREMARQVAHEIKNPLTPIKLGIQHFQRTWTPDAPDAAERLERFSKAMVEQIDALSNIASEFSNFAQMPRAQEEDLDLAEVADGAMAVIGAAEKHFTLDRRTPGPLPIRADREQLLRVFNNLLKNAEQAIPEGREPRIAVVLYRTDSEAIAQVCDNGSGITEADRERIFRPNFTTKSSGMGLGLAMVQRMVEGAGGRVWFETEVGEGTSFFVALPLRP